MNRCLFCGGEDTGPNHQWACDGRQGRVEALYAIEEATGLSHQTVSARLRGLVLREQIEDSGEKARTRSGRWAVVWRAKGG
jgi:hypothetical protein